MLFFKYPFPNLSIVELQLCWMEKLKLIQSDNAEDYVEL